MIRWIKVSKRLPDTDRNVIALSGNGTYLAFASDGEWYLTRTIRLGDVTRWMEFPGEPKDFAYWLNHVREWWTRRKEKAQRAIDWTTGWSSSNAQLGKKPVFYRDRTGKLMTGLPDNLPSPRGYEKIVCTSAREAERYSEMQRRQERVEHGRQMEERESVEAPMRDEIHREMRDRMANARNSVNRDFMRRALEVSAGRRDPWKYERESYLHAEGHEQGH